MTKPNGEPMDVFAQAVEAQHKLAAIFWHFNATMLSESAAINNELMDFVQKRLSEDAAAAAELGRCGTLERAMETLGTFQQKAMDDYTCEAAKLSALNTHVSDALVAEVAEDAEVFAKEVRRRAA